MPRLLMIGCALALIGLAFLLLAEEGEEPSELELHGSDGDPAPMAGSEARLLSGNADAAGKAAREQRETTEEPRQTGPYEFLAVSGETEAPLAGVEIATDEGERLGTTGPDGRLRLDETEHTEIAFGATRAGHLPHRGYAVAGQPVTVTMLPGISIVGRVLHAAGSTPIPHAKLRVWDVDLEREIASLSADEEGRFRIPAVRPNRPFLIVATAEGYVPHRKTENFDLSVRDLEVRIGGGGVLTGTVTDAHGHAMGDTEVLLVWPPDVIRPRIAGVRRPQRGSPGIQDLPGLGEAGTGRTRTNEAGGFEFIGVRLNERVQPLVSIAPRFEARGEVVRFSTEGESLESNILVPQPASLRIYVEDDVGRTLRNATVRVMAGDAIWKVQRCDYLADGSIRLEPVTPCFCSVLAFVADAPGPPEAHKGLLLRPGGEETVRVEFPRGRVLAGRVLNKAGEPIWKAQVGWRCEKPSESAGTTTDMDGAFRLRRLQGGTGTLTVTARDVPYAPIGYEPAKLTGVVPGPKPLEITLLDGTRVRGRFPDLRSGVQVHATLLPGTAGDARMLWLDEERGFTKRGPRVRGIGRVIFRLHRYPPLIVDLARPFVSEETRDLGDLFFEVTNPFQGRVLNGRHRPIRAAKVTLLEDWAGRRSQRTDRDGEFAFAHLPEQDIGLLVEAPGLPPNLAMLRPASQRLQQDIVVRHEGTLDLTVLHEGGRKAARVEVRIKEAGKKQGRGTALNTDKAGHVELRLSPGKYEIGVLILRTRELGEATVDIHAGHTTKRVLKLEGWYTRYMREVRKRNEKKRKKEKR